MYQKCYFEMSRHWRGSYESLTHCKEQLRLRLAVLGWMTCLALELPLSPMKVDQPLHPCTDSIRLGHDSRSHLVKSAPEDCCQSLK